ncbi:XRE family transcriptional regulator [Pseudonocardiaceae bacterium YIM PH 21723]|nr:XRE family transcriptional regulator [Pseudonocardiaceae bacterium YIM PH 21723]
MEPTIRGRELGAALGEVMQRAHKSVPELAHVLDWSRPRLYRLLHGKRGVSNEDLSALLAQCRVTGEQRRRLLELNEGFGAPGWILPTTDQCLLARQERQAFRVRQYATQLIPALLRTPDYARTAGVPGREDIFDLIGHPECVFFLHEQALHTPIGDLELMSEQLHHLIRLAVLPRVSIRVVPPAGPVRTPFRVLEFDGFRPLAYAETPVTAIFYEEHSELAVFYELMGTLDRVALDEEESLACLRRLAAVLDEGAGLPASGNRL